MIRIRKKIQTVLLVLAFVLAGSGCHGKKGMEAFQIPDEFDETKEYEITFWAKNDSNKTQAEIYEQAIADFEALYPNIHVNLRLYNNYGKIYNDVITNISTGTTPNVCITYPDHIATYRKGDNLVVPLEGLFDDERYGLGGNCVRFDSPAQDEIIPQFLQECRFDEHYYALPFMRSTEACYVNKTYVEALGYTLPETLTWDFIFEVSNAALEKDKEGNYLVNGQKVLIPFIYKSTDNMMIQMLKQMNAGYSTDSGELLLFNDTTKQILAAIAENARSGAFSTFSISGYPANFLNAGQCIFAVDSTAGSTWMGTDAPLIDISEDKVVEFELEVMEVPQFSAENPRMISQGPSVCIFNREDSDEVLASWLFTQYLLTNDVQIAYSETEGYVPVTSKAQQSVEYQDYLSRAGEDNMVHYDVKIQAAGLLMENVDHTFVTPVFNGSTSLRNAAGQLIENTVKSARRGEVIDEAYFDKLYKDIVSLYRLDQINSVDNLSQTGKAELGRLPRTALRLLAALAGAWILMGAYAVRMFWKRRRTR